LAAKAKIKAAESDAVRLNGIIVVVRCPKMCFFPIDVGKKPAWDLFLFPKLN
jgi:hypothetical protein